MAIDRDAIIKDVYLGAGSKATTLIPPTLWSFNDKIPDVPFDPEKAKAMLAAAGVKTPLDIDLWYMPVSRPYNPNGKRIGEMMQADLAKVGVNAKLVTYEWGEYRKRLAAGEETTGQYGWTGDNGDPDNFFFFRGCPGGKPGDSNPDEMVQRRVRRAAGEGPHPDKPGRSGETLFAHAGDRARRGPGASRSRIRSCSKPCART